MATRLQNGSPTYSVYGTNMLFSQLTYGIWMSLDSLLLLAVTKTVIALVNDFKMNTYKPKLGNAKNRDLVTVIEGSSTPGNYIYRTIYYRQRTSIMLALCMATADTGLPKVSKICKFHSDGHDNWTFTTSPNSFTDDVLGLEWSQHIHAESILTQVAEDQSSYCG